MDRLLYFPYIELPTSEWTIRNLLYWDEISSIVPYDYVERPHRFGRNMLELVREGLVTQVFPEQYVYNISGFENNFIRYIEKNKLYSRLSDIGKMGELGQSKILKTTRIHMGKMEGIGEELVDRGLAYRKGRWYEVESRTAEAFMTYLAFLLGGKINSTPVTDDYLGFNTLLNIEKEPPIYKTRVRNELRATILENILPVPNRPVSATEILRFKYKYHDELRSYRNYIETFIIELQQLDDDNRLRMVNIFTEESRDQINHIKEKMSWFGNIDFSFVSICSIASTILPVFNAYQSNELNDLISGIPGLLGTIASTFKKNDIEELRNRPLAYGAILENRMKSNHSKIY